MEKTTEMPVNISFGVNIERGIVTVVIPINSFIGNNVVSVKLPPETVAEIKDVIKEEFRSTKNHQGIMH